MRHLHKLLTSLFVSALVLGCGDRPGVTEPASSETPSFKSEVSRSEEPLVLAFGDARLGINTLMGVSLEAFCSGEPIEEVAQVKIVTHVGQQGDSSEHVRIVGREMTATVWSPDLGPGGDICTLQGVQPLAVGTVRIDLHDNEGKFFLTDQGANAFSIRAGGMLTSPSTGQRYHLMASIQIIVLPDGRVQEPPVTFLRLTPVGK